MFEIGYVTTEYADEYVSNYFLSTDTLRTTWEGLSEEDKEILLRKSFAAIESLPFSGRKSCPAQPYAFPRYPSKEVPEAVKQAQVENALSLSDTSSTEDAAFYERLWQFGVESYSIGNLSEHTSSGAWGRGSTTAISGIISAKSSKLLQPFLNGGYCIVGGKP